MKAYCLGELVNIVGGGTPSRKVADYWGGAIPWATVKDFKTEVLSKTLECITQTGVKNSATNIIPAGNIIVPTRMALGKAAINLVDLAINQDLKALIIRDKSLVDREYLLRFLLSKSSFIESQGNGATVKGITIDVLKDLELELPPLAEQRRIAAILDKADAIRRKRQRAIELTEEFLRSAFLEMFGDPRNHVSGWPQTKFGDTAILDAPMVDPRKEKYLDLLHVGPDRIEKETGRLLTCKTAREENLISGKFLFDEKYVLYSKIRPYLRKAALPNFVGLCSADMYPIRPAGRKATREYLFMLLLSEAFFAYTERLPSRANIPKLNRKELADYVFPLPPYEKQKQFSILVKKYQLNKVHQEHYLNKAQVLFQSLTHLAFRGELTQASADKILQQTATG